MTRIYITRASSQIKGFLLMWTKNPRGQFNREMKEWGTLARDHAVLLTESQARVLFGDRKFPRVGSGAIQCYRFDVTYMRRA